MNKVIADCDAQLILIDSDIALLRRADMWNPLSKTRKEWPDDSKVQVTNKILQSLKGQKPFEFDEVTSPDDLAFFQYTSGSTGDPKGVMVTFGALSANVRLILNLIHRGAERDGTTTMPSEVRGFSWLPQYHDLGLIHGTIAPFAAGWRMHMMSPLDFIKNPLLWLDLMSRHRVFWGMAPDFAYSLVARKFIEAKKRNNGIEPIPGLDLSSIGFLENAAEPIRTATVKTFGEVFAKYGLREKWFVASYGLAENVVGVCAVHGYYLSDPRDEDKFPLVACGSRDTFEPGLVIKIVDTKSLKEVEDGETGEIWVSGPSVAAGYFQKPELTEEVFRAKMDGSQQKFLRTGDLAFFHDDKLFICGRMKDLIIINGVNYYPQDVEYAVQDASAAVRPGCVAAFSSSDMGDFSDGVEIVFEIRNARLKDADEVIQVVRSSITQRIGLAPSRIVAIKERTIPKTTSGKIKRKATRSSLHGGKLDIVAENRTVSIHTNQGLQDQKQLTMGDPNTDTTQSTEDFAHMDFEAIHDLLDFSFEEDAATVAPTPHLIQHELCFDDTSQSLPHEAVAVIRGIEVNIDKLNLTFHELGLHLIPEFAREWELADKSHSAFQAICETSMRAIEKHHPVLVQFAHLLHVRPDWISADNGKEILLDMVHCGFVLNWATCKLGTSTEIMQRKMRLDAELESLLITEHVAVQVPEDFRFMVDGKVKDPMFGALDPFQWLKYRSATYALKQLLAPSGENIREANDEGDLLSLNILETVWLDEKLGLTDNSFVGKWLAARTTCSQEGCRMHLKECSRFAQLYLSWNLASSMILENPSLAVATLLIPCIVGCEADLFLWNRNISLYLAMNAMVAKLLRGHRSGAFVSQSATKALGALNRKWATSLDPVDPPEQPAASWLRKLDKWEKESVLQNECPNEAEKEKTATVKNKQAKIVDAEGGIDLVRRTVASMLGVPPDEIPLNRPLAEIGLTSMMALELSDTLSSSTGMEFPVTRLFGDSTTLETIASFIEGIDLPSLMTNTMPSTYPHDEPIAVIGIGCRLPGSVESVQDFWCLLSNEVDAIREIPKERWDLEEFYDPSPCVGNMITKWGGVVDNIDLFDPAFFSLSESSAACMDPQARLTLECSWEALESGGVLRENLKESRIGVYVGITSNEYQVMSMGDPRNIKPHYG